MAWKWVGDEGGDGIGRGVPSGVEVVVVGGCVN